MDCSKHLDPGISWSPGLLRQKLANLDASLTRGKYSLERCSARVKHPPSNFSRASMENMEATFQAAAATTQ